MARHRIIHSIKNTNILFGSYNGISSNKNQYFCLKPADIELHHACIEHSRNSFIINHGQYITWCPHNDPSFGVQILHSQGPLNSSMRGGWQKPTAPWEVT